MNNWDNLRYYLAVARSGTVSAAAKKLNVSHATVLRRIEQCESELGIKLFKHLQSGYVLSTAGEKLLSQVEDMESLTLDIERDFQDQDQALSGPLKVTQPGNGIIDLYPLYAQFRQLYPQIELDILPSAELVDLNRHEADIAIRFTDTPQELLIGHQLKPIQFRPYVSQTLMQSTDSKRFEDYDWILWRPTNRSLDDSFQYDWLKKHCKNPKVVMQTSSVSDIISAVRAGIGAGMLSEQIITNYYPDFAIINAEKTLAGKQLWVLAHRDLRNIKRVKVFMRFIRDALADVDAPR
ncbi:MAG: LysR family transcriptional regulator [Pseudomonadales bacterium]|nr:LysR family transcriptional regulator [Pseudomonadales bacterium]